MSSVPERLKRAVTHTLCDTMSRKLDADTEERVVRPFAHKEGISDRRLQEAVCRASRGQVDADLGGGVIKQRLVREGQGKSRGYRAVILYREDGAAFFVYG